MIIICCVITTLNLIEIPLMECDFVLLRYYLPTLQLLIILRRTCEGEGGIKLDTHGQDLNYIGLFCTYCVIALITVWVNLCLIFC